MRWLELDWTRAPRWVVHKDRTSDGAPTDFQEFAERPRARRAYRCYCTRKSWTPASALKATDPRRGSLPGTCGGKDRTISPSWFGYGPRRVGHYNDLVFGAVTTTNSAQQACVSAPGVPLYNARRRRRRRRHHLVHARAITCHTQPQNMIYERRLRSPRASPTCPDARAERDKLSKRHGAVSVEEYKKLGYPPSGVLNTGQISVGPTATKRSSRARSIKNSIALVRSDGKFDPRSSPTWFSST